MDKKKAKKLKMINKFIFVAISIILAVLMGLSAKVFLEDNTSSSVIHDPTFRTEIIDSDELNYIIDIPITIKNSGYFSIGESNIKIAFSNGSDSLDISFTIPSIKAGETLKTNLSYVIEFSSAEDFYQYESFMTTINRFEFCFELQYFLFPITIEGEFIDFNMEEGG